MGTRSSHMRRLASTRSSIGRSLSRPAPNLDLVKRALAVVVAAVALAACSSGGGSGTSHPTTTPQRTSSTPPLHALKDLEDGKHLGFVTALDPGHKRLVFDVGELFSGDAATEAAHDGGG